MTVSKIPLPVLLLFILLATAAGAETPIRYDVSLDQRDHHELHVEVTFEGLSETPIEILMSRASPGRYALHEFAKNVYDVSAVDGEDRGLSIERPDLHQWTVANHDGTVRFRYTLFGDLADGTYSGIDSSHAHLNIPATFVWARGLEDRPVEVHFDLPKGWTVATQLVAGKDETYSAANLAEFMDSPIEAGPLNLSEWTVGTGDSAQTVQVALHHTGGDEEAEILAHLAESVVAEQIATFGEAPTFDHGRYTFLVDATPWVDGDGMEHRNSTVVTTSGTVEERIGRLLGTMSHEFFHAWNIERIRPRSLEPFDFERANMSSELWFGEGFTSYYGSLVLTRLGLQDLEKFVQGLGYSVGGVLGSPGIRHMSPAEMSAQAPFVDDAVTYAPTNRGNTFVSYYTYGAVLALGLDLELRTRFEAVTLDDYMRAAWQRFGVSETPYTNDDLQQLLGELVGDQNFADDFFDRSINGREARPFESLLADFGLRLRRRDPAAAWFGEGFAFEEEKKSKDGKEDSPGGARIPDAVLESTPLFAAGVGRGDLLLELDGKKLSDEDALEELLADHAPGDTLELLYEKRGEERTVELELVENPEFEVVTFEAAGEELTAEVLARRAAWLEPHTAVAADALRYCPETGQPHPFSYRYCPIHGDDLQLLPKEWPPAKAEEE
ncbi:MAG: PDZ domain-containing protein [Thermoanaerobaculia bacterium]|nr:PDZ domain-containing protein [Thermoanaerobaculia bacterium]